MNLHHYFLLSFFILFIQSCNNNRDFSEVKNLNSLEQTKFATTLESKINSKINSIYAASLLMAWDEVKNEIAEPIINIESDDLVLMNNSKTYHNVLKKSEYESSVKIDGSNITTSAFFQKSLLFDFPLEKYINDFSFLDEKVNSFGFNGFHKSCKILYYKNNNDFAVKLLPKDEEHEIILIKSNFSKSLTVKNEIEKLNKKVKLFHKKKNDKNFWKYYFNEEDKVRIPILDFNLEHNFETLEETVFNTENNEFLIKNAYQRTAFLLDEKGAKVESEAAMAVEVKDEIEEVKVKALLFDNSFIVLLKRKVSKYPYFAVYIANSELMVK